MRTILALAALTLLPGCLVAYDTDGAAPVPAGADVVIVNEAPIIEWADAGCGWDPVYRDFVWTFDAEVNDWDGLGDVTAVFADVYDSWSGAWVDGFELGRVDAYAWNSAWIGGDTFLDCGYPDYEVDFVAVDTRYDEDVVTVIPGRW